MTPVDLHLDHGHVSGIFVPSATRTDAPLVVITNGHNGFYNYGMFPYIQAYLSRHQISSFSYNFSHGGVRGGNDTFTDLDAYEKNCMRLETADLSGVLRSMENEPTLRPYVERPVFLLSHSLGVVPTLFAAGSDRPSGPMVAGIILLAPIRTLDIFPESMMEEWNVRGVFHLMNNRTGQALPQGAELLSEIQKSDTVWNLERAVRGLNVPILAIHGADDNDVPSQHSESIVAWARASGTDAKLVIVPDVGHTFNTNHPFQESTAELEGSLEKVVDWIHNDRMRVDNLRTF